MSARHPTRSEREQLELFRALPGDLAPRDAQDLMAYPFFSLAKTDRTTPIDFRMTGKSWSGKHRLCVPR
jgi:plasmid replication initiation protein